MGRLIEQREYEEPKWEEFLWVIDGARINGHLSLVEEGEKVRKVRVAVGIPSDAQVISFGSVVRHPIEWNSETGERKREPGAEDVIEISWYSPGLRIGRNILIPRELTERLEDGFRRIQIVDVSLYSYFNNEPTVKDIS